MDALALSKFQYALDDIFFGVDDDVVSTVCLGQLSLVLSRRCTDDMRAEMRSKLGDSQQALAEELVVKKVIYIHLAQRKTQAACGCVNKDPIAFLDLVCFADRSQG